MTQYCFLMAQSASFCNALHILDLFGNCSGLKINIQKTNAIWIGASKCNEDIELEGRQVNFVHNDFFRYLGADFHVVIDKIPDYNYDRIFDKVKRQMISWIKRNITVLGRVTVAKSLLLPQFNHLFMAIPDPSAKLMKTIKVKFFNFIWKNKPDKISRKQVVGTYEEGGLKMPDIEFFNMSLKLTWLQRMVLGTCNDVSHLMQSFLTKPFVVGFGDEYFSALSHEVANPFWRHVFHALSMLSRIEGDDWLTYPLWRNSSIKIGQKSVFFKSWYEKGIRCINDLIDDKGKLLTREQCEQKFCLKLNYLSYYSVTQAIKCRYQMHIEKCEKM